MHCRYLLIAASALAFACPTAAEPPKPATGESAKPLDRPAPVMLASAEQARAPAPTEQAQNPTPAKRPRAARLTGCRCGDQIAEQQ